MSDSLIQFYQTSEKYLKMIDYHTNPHRLEVTRQYVNFVEREACGYQTILDLGCGPGLSSYLLSQKGFIVTGVDISQKFLDVSKSKQSERLHLVQGDVCALEFADNSFDIVTSHELIEHLRSVDGALQEMCRVVKKGGKVIILGPNLSSPLSALRAKTLRLFVKNSILLVKKYFQSQPDFVTLKPQLDSFSASEEDAVYLSAFLDIYKWLKNNRLKVNLATFPEQRLWGKFLSKYFPSFASGIKIVGEKV